MRVRAKSGQNQGGDGEMLGKEPQTLIYRSVFQTFQTKIIDIIEYTLKQKWKRAGHTARLKDNRWTKRCTEWQPRREVERTTKQKMAR